MDSVKRDFVERKANPANDCGNDRFQVVNRHKNGKHSRAALDGSRMLYRRSISDAFYSLTTRLACCCFDNVHTSDYS